MKQYIGTKVIMAEPMTMTEAQKVLGREIKPATVEEDGYLVEYKDGYNSFITMLNNRFRLNGYDGWWFDDTIKKFTFADCTPFGVKVEE